MGIKVSKTTNQPSIVFDELWLRSFHLDQPLDESGKKMVKLRTFLTGKSTDGEWEHDPDTKWDFNTTDFNTFAVKLYMKQNNATLDDAMGAYQAAKVKANSANIMEAMAFFEAGIALIYEDYHADESEVQ